MSALKRSGAIGTVIILLMPGVFAQQPQQPVASPAPEPEYVNEKGFRGRVFEIKNRDPHSIMSVVRPLGSGFKGATMSVNQHFNTLTVRDFPENIAVIEEALKRLDTPEAPRPDTEFRIHILVATNGTGPVEALPGDISDVVQQLRSTLKYRNYHLMASALHRTREGRLSNSGVAESKLFGLNAEGYPTFYQYGLDRVVLASGPSGVTINIGNVGFNMRMPLGRGTSAQVQYETVGFGSPITVRDGEKLVVGTTTIEDKGLIFVLSARVIK